MFLDIFNQGLDFSISIQPFLSSPATPELRASIQHRTQLGCLLHLWGFSLLVLHPNGHHWMGSSCDKHCNELENSSIFLQPRPDNGSFHVSTSSVIGTSGIPFTFTFDLDNILLGAALLPLIEFDLWLLKLCMRH